MGDPYTYVCNMAKYFENSANKSHRGEIVLEGSNFTISLVRPLISSANEAQCVNRRTFSSGFF